MYTEEEGSTDVSKCKSCNAGHYCPVGTAEQIPCEAGTYNPDKEKFDPSDCLSCLAGKACTKAGLANPDLPCSAGYYCPGGNHARAQTEYACPAGTYTDHQNLTHVDQCQKCPATKACPAGTGGLQQAPLVCGKGYYCPEGTGAQDQFPCPAGSYSNLTNLRSFDECYECPRTFYCLEASQEPTGLCAQGHYCPDGKYILVKQYYHIFWLVRQSFCLFETVL